MDFFVVPTVSFRLIYVWFVMDHVVVLGEDYLRRLLRDYLTYNLTYYNADRVHTVIRDVPVARAIDARPSPDARVVGPPRVGGLHNRYAWKTVA